MVPGLGKIKWKSTNRRVATVNSKGSLTAKKAGTTTIVARAKKGGAQALFTIHVRANEWVGDMKTRHANLHYPVNFLGFRVLKMYYRGKKLYVEGFWANNTPSDYNRLKTSLEIRDASHGNRLIGRKTLQFKAPLPSYKCQIYNMTYVFKGKELKAKNYDLAGISNLNFQNYLR